MAHPSVHYDEEGTDLTPPGEGFELYRHKNAEKMGTKKWLLRLLGLAHRRRRLRDQQRALIGGLTLGTRDLHA
jgi:hypothetical protein